MSGLWPRPAGPALAGLEPVAGNPLCPEARLRGPEPLLFPELVGGLAD